MDKRAEIPGRICVDHDTLLLSRTGLLIRTRVGVFIGRVQRGLHPPLRIAFSGIVFLQ